MQRSSDRKNQTLREPYLEFLPRPFDDEANRQRDGNLTRIARRYNVRAISPRAMVELSTDLYAAGFLTPVQHNLLSFQAELQPNFDTTIGALTGELADPDRPRDYSKIWQQRLDFEKKHADNAERIIQRTQQILDLLESIEEKPKVPQSLIPRQTAAKPTLNLPPLRLGYDKK